VNLREKDKKLYEDQIKKVEERNIYLLNEKGDRICYYRKNVKEC
jgi:hypothetical protein